MTRVLITGMSGTGKSTLLDELAVRGYPTVDTDYGHYYELVDGERLWRADRIEALLRSTPTGSADMLFVQGTTRNQGVFYPWFEHIVLLSAPAQVLIERLIHPPRTRTARIPPSSRKRSSTSKRSSPCCAHPRPSRSSRPFP